MHGGLPMTQTSDYYDARADEAEAAAGRADLDNVRDREMRSAAVFRMLADNVRKIHIARAKAEVVRQERRAAETEKAVRARWEAEHEASTRSPSIDGEDYGAGSCKAVCNEE
jgi:hypothetical protein